MPRPYDYSIPGVDIMGAIGAYEAGREKKRADVAQGKQDLFAQYLPKALDGDKEAMTLAQQNATPEQAMQLKQSQFSQQERVLKIAQEVAALLGSTPDGDEAGFERAKQQWVQMGLPADAVAAFTVADLPALRIKAGAQERELRTKLLGAQIESQRANTAQSYAAAEASKALAGFRGAGGLGHMGRPMSQGVQSKEDDDIADIQSVQSVNTQIDQVLNDLRTGALDLGPINNLLSRGQNLAGLSTPGSRNFAALEATLEKMRNDSLRLNKGVQTEGDAIRAWNEITKYITDPKVVAEQLERVKNLNAIAARQRLQRINIRRARNGYNAFDPAEIDYGGGVQSQATSAPDDFSDVDELLGLK